MKRYLCTDGEWRTLAEIREDGARIKTFFENGETYYRIREEGGSK